MALESKLTNIIWGAATASWLGMDAFLATEFYNAYEKGRVMPNIETYTIIAAGTTIACIAYWKREISAFLRKRMDRKIANTFD